MKNFLKQMNLFYGVIVLLISILFLRPILTGGVVNSESQSYMNMYIFYIAGLVFTLLSLVFMDYIFLKVKYGAIKSIDDIRYIKPNRIITMFMIIAVITFLVSGLYYLPKAAMQTSVGFVGVILGKSPLSYSMWGIIISIIILIYVLFFSKSLENDLPRRRRSIKRVNVDINEFLRAFIPHIPALINIIVVIVFFMALRTL